MCTGTAYTDQDRHVGSSHTVFNDENDFGGNYNKIATNYNSVRCVLLLPSPSMNLNTMRRNKETKHDHYAPNNTWNNNFDDEDNNNFSEDEMELNFNEFNVKISANHDDDGYHHHQKSRKSKDRKIGGKKNKNYHDNEFWILSGTSNGSMLLHKLNNNDGTDDEDDINGNSDNYVNYL